VTCLQVYSYFSQHCESDKPILRYFVGGLSSSQCLHNSVPRLQGFCEDHMSSTTRITHVNRAFESLQMALLIHSYYVAGVTNFGDFASDAKALMYVEDPADLQGLALNLTVILVPFKFRVSWEVRDPCLSKRKVHMHNYGYLSLGSVGNSAVCSSLLGWTIVFESPPMEHHIRFYAWRIYQCRHLPNTVCGAFSAHD